MWNHRLYCSNHENAILAKVFGKTSVPRDQRLWQNHFLISLYSEEVTSEALG